MIRILHEAMSGEKHVGYYDILHDCAVAIDAKVVIDLGTFYGGSAEAFAKAMAKTGGVVNTIDIRGEDNPVGKEFYIRSAKQRLADRKHLSFIKGDSVEVAKMWVGDVDIVFCDSDHSYDHVMGELTEWGKHNPKVFFIHDTFLPPPHPGEPYKAMVDYATANEKPYFNIDTGPGLGVIVMRWT